MPDFRLPDLGEGVHEGQIIRLHAKAGDFVTEDAPFMEVETDKAAVEIRAPFTGVIEQWHVKEGQLAHVGDVMVTWRKGTGDDHEKGSAAAPVGRGLTSGEGAAARGDLAGGGASGGGTSAGTALLEPRATPGSPGRIVPASPATRKLARELGLDINAMAGSGPNGRVTREDVERAAAGSVFSPLPSGERQGEGAGRSGAADMQPGHPSFHPSSARGFRRGGREEPSPQPSPRGRGSAPPSSFAPQPSIASAASAIPPGEDSTDAHGPVRIVANSQARKTIAANMTQSWTTIPHVTDSDDADVTDLEALRKGYPSPANGNRKLTMLAFIVRAVAQALTRHPVFNAVFDADRQAVVYKRYIHISVGVHTERGLVAPVIRDADRLSVIQIADALDAIIEKARTASFTVADTRGGTYTISNAGAFGGSHYSTPIVAPGQCAVLAVGRTRWMPWVVKERILPRFIMPLSHSFDHRIADGGQEIAFLQDVIGQLENPARLMY